MNITKTELAAIIASAVDAGMKAARANTPAEIHQPTSREEPTELLSNGAAAHAAIAKELPKLRFPTWLLLGQDTTCVWSILGLLKVSQASREKVSRHIHKQRVGCMTVQNFS